MANEEMKVGSQVQGANGGPALTIEKIEGDSAQVFWWDKNKKIHRDTLPLAALKPYKKTTLGVRGRVF